MGCGRGLAAVGSREPFHAALTFDTGTAAAAPAELPLARLGTLLDVASRVRGERELDGVLEALADTISAGLGWGKVVINLYRPAWDDFQVTTVHGSNDARDELLGATSQWAEWKPLLAERTDDRLVVPLARSDGHLLGMLSVEEPRSGAPTDDELDLLSAVATQAARAVEQVH